MYQQGVKKSVFRKKLGIGLTGLLMVMMLLSGCGDKEKLVEADFVLEGNQTTIRGIGPGSTVEELKEAYPGVSLLGEEDAAFSYVDKEDEVQVDYNAILISAFFVDGTHMTADQLCKDYSVEAESLVSYLSSAAFLKEHKVVYHFLQFAIEDGTVTQVCDGSLDYNEEFGQS